MTKLEVIRKCIPIALALTAVGLTGIGAASARPVVHSRHHLYMYAPGYAFGGYMYAPGGWGAAFQPDGSQRTGTAADRADHPGNY
jgi:hypothetical protein